MSDVWNSSEAETGSSMSYTIPSNHQNQVAQRSDKSSSSSEQVRSRWTPKPEQILILESIFNSGMVNPPKDETVRIRRLLEKFGPVGDANVFYWFQNRRSRSRRRQRQIQANMEAATRNAQNTINYDPPTSSNFHNNNMIIPTASGFPSAAGSCGTSIMPHFFIPSSSEILSASSSSNLGSTGFGSSGTVEGFFSEMGYEDMEENGSQGPSFLTSDVPSDLQYQQQQPGGGFVTVFINGVPTEVPMGPLNMKEICGQDVLLVHSSGHPVSINEFGFSTHSLQHGESYFLVGK